MNTDVNAQAGSTAEVLAEGMRYQWQMLDDPRDVDALAGELHISRLLARLLIQREHLHTDDPRIALDPKLKHLHDPATMPGMIKAATRIIDAIRNDQTLAIYGDYDVDGLVASAVMRHALQAIEPDVKLLHYIPDRLDEGYGLNTAAIDHLIGQGAELIVSVDCGIASCDVADHARQRGVDLIITDHHEPGESLPDAFAVVHPRLHDKDPSCDTRYPFGWLCGAGVAYKLAWQCMRQAMDDPQGKRKLPETWSTLLVELLSMVAVATIADVVPLVGENRVIARFGLRQLPHTPFVGLRKLLEGCDLLTKPIESFHVGFVIGPRLNACGRLSHASPALKLLTDATEAEADELAEQLDALNVERRSIGHDIFEQACAKVTERFGEHLPPVLVLSDDAWHPGVVGIIASRLVEQFGRPTLLLCRDNGRLRGSGRSVPGVNLVEALRACADDLLGFGGHAMAVGLSVDPERVEAFEQSLTRAMAGHADLLGRKRVVQVASVVRCGELSLALLDELSMLEPYGSDNDRPMLMLRGVQVRIGGQRMGRGGAHLRLAVGDDSGAIGVIGWNKGDWSEHLRRSVRADMIGYIERDSYTRPPCCRFVVEDMRIIG